MRSVMFDMPAEELDQRLLDSIKVLFKGKRLKIVVYEETPNESEKSLKEIIAENRNTGFSYQLSAEAFSGIADQFVAEENFDVLNAIEQYKAPRK